MTRRTLIATGALLLTASTTLVAHDLFIKMDAYHLPPDTPVVVPILNSTFLVSENSITPDRVADVSVVVDGHRKRLGLDGWDAGGDTTFLEMRTGEPGTYVLGVSTRPDQLGMSAADFNQYLALDGVGDVLKQRAVDRELDLDAWEEYSKHVKAVFQVGDRHSSGFDLVLGYPAELVPLANPYEMSVGGVMELRALVDGEPVSGQLVIAGGVTPDGDVIEEREARSGPEGSVSFRVDEPGRWYAKFINMQKTDAPDLDYESKWATISWEIR